MCEMCVFPDSRIRVAPLSSAPTHLVPVPLLLPLSLFLVTLSPPLPLTLLLFNQLTWLPSPMVLFIPPPLPHQTISSDLNYLYVCTVITVVYLSYFPCSPTYMYTVSLCRASPRLPPCCPTSSPSSSYRSLSRCSLPSLSLPLCRHSRPTAVPFQTYHPSQYVW